MRARRRPSVVPAACCVSTAQLPLSAATRRSGDAVQLDRQTDTLPASLACAACAGPQMSSASSVWLVASATETTTLLSRRAAQRAHLTSLYVSPYSSYFDSMPWTVPIISDLFRSCPWSRCTRSHAKTVAGSLRKLHGYFVYIFCTYGTHFENVLRTASTYVTYSTYSLLVTRRISLYSPLQ